MANSRESDLRKELAALTDPAPAKGVIVEEDFSENYSQLKDFEENEDEEEVAAEQRVTKNLRKLNVPLLEDTHVRYEGKKVSRKELYSDESESESEDEISDWAESPDVIEMEDSQSDEGEKGEEEGESEDEEEEEEDDFEEMDDGDDVMLQAEEKKKTETEKGKAVQQQFQLWDQLMGARIRIQKLLQAVNQMPQSSESWALYLDKKKDRDTQKNSIKGLEGVLSSLLTMQNQLYSKTPALVEVAKGNGGKATHDDDEIPSSSDEDMTTGYTDETYKEAKKKGKKRKFNLEGQEAVIAKRHEAYRTHRDEVLMKWFERTRMASGRFSSKSQFSSFETNVVKQINQILANKTRLVLRTQTKRSDYTIFGSRDTKEYEEETGLTRNKEILDDQDFYQTLLRELIQRKSGSTKDPAATSRQWIEMERLRQTRKKMAVDTKASKGRKIRYDVKPKLVNLMAPVEPQGVWRSEEAKNELFSSLFGQRPITEEP